MVSAFLDLFSLSQSLKALPVTHDSAITTHTKLNELRNLEGMVEEAIAHTKSLRNLQNCVLNRLPPEILATIFSFLQPDMRSETLLPPPTDFREWACVTRMCRHWRQVALSYPDLWGKVLLDDNSAEVALQWLRRSGNVPFDFYFAGTLPGTSTSEKEALVYDALLQILLELPRLKGLHIRSSWVLNSSFWDLLCRPAPLLESLSVKMGDDSTGEAVSVLPRIFCDEMPQLRNIYLSNVSAWPYNHFRNLLRLHLYDQPANASPTLTTFLQILQASSATLQELILVRAGPFRYDLTMGKELYESAPRIHLPALRYIEVGDTDPWLSGGDHLELFFSHIVIPPTTKSCFFERMAFHITPSMYFPETGENKSLPIIRKLVLTSFRPTTIHRYMIGHVDSTIYINFGRETPDFILQFADPDFLKYVEELVYAPDANHEKYFDKRLFKALPSLRTIRFHADNLLYRLSDILQEREKGDSGSKFKYAPHLEHLSIYAASEMPKELRRLIEIVGSRCAVGQSLKRVEVEGFGEYSQGLRDVCENSFVFASESGESSTSLGIEMEDVLSEFWESYSDQIDNFW